MLLHAPVAARPGGRVLALAFISAQSHAVLFNSRMWLAVLRCWLPVFRHALRNQLAVGVLCLLL
jgi:hypothetical protein